MTDFETLQDIAPEPYSSRVHTVMIEPYTPPEDDDPVWIRHYLGGDIDGDSAAATIAALYDVDSQYPDATLEFVINSPGGELTHGCAIYSELAAMSQRGGGEHKVITKIRGEAGSIASLIFQAGDWRVGGKLDSLLLHLPHQTQVDANATILRAKIIELEAWTGLYADVHADRATISRKAFLDRLGTGEDWILTLEEAVDLGLADEIA